MSFSYKLVNDNTSELYQRMLVLDSTAFLGWRNKTTGRQNLPVEKCFRAWWIQKGRTGFKTSEDSARYRKELEDTVHIAVAKQDIDEVVEGIKEAVAERLGTTVETLQSHAEAGTLVEFVAEKQNERE